MKKKIRVLIKCQDEKTKALFFAMWILLNGRIIVIE